MSYSDEIKQSICAQLPRSMCCKRAFLQGMLTARGRVEQGRACLRLTKRYIIDVAVRMIADCYGKQATVSHDRSQGIAQSVSFASPKAVGFLEDLENGKTQPLFASKCEECHSYFLRGMFLVCGRIEDPAKRFRLEFSANERTDIIAGHLSEYLPAYAAYHRREEVVILLRDSDTIEKFFLLMGDNTQAFSVMNVRITKEMNRDINRLTNCETNNIHRAVRGASKIIGKIEELERLGLLSSLPTDLHETAKLRLANREVSIGALASLASPPLTKSGMAHRLAKLSQYADDLLRDKHE